MHDRNELHYEERCAYRDARDSLTEMERAPRTEVIGGVWVTGCKEDERGC
tara:strand:- start:245 stop:394 length:150 start_codon:yes stop_codon:yes gene_type:complete